MGVVHAIGRWNKVKGAPSEAQAGLGSQPAAVIRFCEAAASPRSAPSRIGAGAPDSEAWAASLQDADMEAGETGAT